MKIVVLLALVGLASCRTPLIGRDRARDVKIEYSFDDDSGKEVTVEVKADRLGLGSFKQALRPSFRRVETPVAHIPVHAPVFFRTTEFDDIPKTKFKTQYVEMETTKPVFRQMPVARPRQRTQVVHEATPVVTQYVEMETTKPVFRQVPVARPRQRTQVMQEATPVVTQYDRADPRPAPRTVFVQPQTFPVMAFRPAISQFIDVEADPPQRVVTQYTQTHHVSVPTVARTRFVKADDDDIPVVYQAARQVVPSFAPVRAAYSQPSVRRSFVLARKPNVRYFDDDNSSEK